MSGIDYSMVWAKARALMDTTATISERSHFLYWSEEPSAHQQDALSAAVSTAESVIQEIRRLMDVTPPSAAPVQAFDEERLPGGVRDPAVEPW